MTKPTSKKFNDAKPGPGRRKGPITFAGKSVYKTLGFTPALKRLIEAAEARTGRSWSELVALCSLTKATMRTVTLKDFEHYQSSADGR